MATTAPATIQTQPIGFRAVRRRIADSMDGARSDNGDDSHSLESQRLAPADPPRLARANPLEHPVIRRCPVNGEPTAGFAAFLDGIQASRVVLHDDGIPIVHGVIGAAIRQRVDRRLGTWRVEAEERVYAPRAFLSPESDAAIAGLDLGVVDITPRKSGGEPDEDARHPLSLADVAVSAVQAHREALELRLAGAWIDSRNEPLYVDGNISGGAQLAASSVAVGVVKSHRTLYGDTAAVRTILKLAAGERSSVFTVSSPNGWRSTVASWYLRLRESANPLWGLVRVEVSMPSDADRPALGSRADQISRWILAEASPLSLPDSRWGHDGLRYSRLRAVPRSILR